MAAALELGRRIAGQPWSEPIPVRTPDDLARGLIARYGHRHQEHLVCVFLNSRHAVICERVLFVGTINSALVSTREPIAAALGLHARAIVICHNHASGDPTPSSEDEAYTLKLRDACKPLDIELLDHIIVSPGRYQSMKKEGYLP